MDRNCPFMKQGTSNMLPAFDTTRAIKKTTIDSCAPKQRIQQHIRRKRNKVLELQLRRNKGMKGDSGEGKKRFTESHYCHLYSVEATFLRCLRNF